MVNQLLSNGFRSGKLMNPKGAEKNDAVFRRAARL
jgi:hypothetical protein